MKEKRNSFGGSFGFVMAAAGSAVGLGNLWRFPYLAARDGGGLFLVIYLILAVTFGFSLLATEVAIGRKTKQSPLTAYERVKKGWKPLGVIASLIPVIIMPYYSAIGGWVTKYFVTFLTGQGIGAAEDGFFTGFITSDISPIIYMTIFLAVCGVIIYRGVNKGIEAMSRILMPILICLILGISVFSLTLKFTDASGVSRTGLQGLGIFMIPSLKGIGIKGFFSVVVDAMGQLFFSLSVAMGIMVAYGSYVDDKADLSKSIAQIEFFDTLVAFLAGVMIIPAVFTFMGHEGMNASGPSLMFITLPKVFASMGSVGTVIGIMFFATVLFAALTSAVSVMEAVVVSLMDQLKISRAKATLTEGLIALAAGIVVCLGYNVFYFELPLPNGSVAQVLDLMDYLSNNIFMPIVAIATCVLIGWIVKTDYVIDEIEKNGEKFGRGKLLTLMIRYIAPVLLFILFLKSAGILTAI